MTTQERNTKQIKLLADMLKLQLGLKQQKSLKTRSIGWSLELLSQQPWEIGPLPNDKNKPFLHLAG